MIQSSQKNIRPVDDRTIEQLIDDDFILIDNRTQQELEDDGYIELESDDNVDIDLTAAWDPKQTTVSADYGKPKIKLSTDFNKKVQAANKIKKKYLRKKISNRSQHKIYSSVQKWFKNAGYLDTKDQDSINYTLVQPSKKVQNSVQDEIESTDFKKSNLTLKKERTGKQQQKTPYTFEKNKKEDNMIESLEDIAMLRLGKNAQIAAKKISKKYQKRRLEKRRASRKRKIEDEIVPTREKKYRKVPDVNKKRKKKTTLK